MECELVCNNNKKEENREIISQNNVIDDDKIIIVHDEEINNKEIIKRPNRTKKRSHLKRELTPLRYLIKDEDEDAFIFAKPSEQHFNGKERSSSSTSETISRQGSFHKSQISKKGSISELAQLFNKTKKSLTHVAQRGRERFRKYEAQLLVKRSQSAPKFVEQLQESLEKVQQHQEPFRRRKYSDPDYFTTLNNGSSLFTKKEERKLLIRPSSPSSSSSKIIEVLDPKTKTILQRKSVSASGQTKDISLTILEMRNFKDFFKNFQIHKRQFREDYLKIKTTFHRCCCEIFLIMVFCGLGGLIFKFTEGTFESYYKCGVKRVKRDFIDLLWIKSHNLREDDWKSLARMRLRKFEEELHSAHEAGMTDYSGMRSWSFLNGIVYSLTIITTIGYGHMYPKTHTGRALSIVYALIGIPLFLIALTDFGKLFTRAIKFVWSFVRRLYYTGSCRKVRRNAGVDDIFKGAQNLYDYATFRRPSLFDPNTPTPTSTSNNNPAENNDAQRSESPTTPAISNFEIDDEFNLPISVALFILVAYIFCGACMYMVIEKWNFFESFYFVFISMSTIGFGDYVPRDPFFMIGSIIYLVFGLALMSMCINVVQAKLSDTFKQASFKIGTTMGLEVVDDDEDLGSVILTPETVTEPVKLEIANEIQ